MVENKSTGEKIFGVIWGLVILGTMIVMFFWGIEGGFIRAIFGAIVIGVITAIYGAIIMTIIRKYKA